MSDGYRAHAAVFEPARRVGRPVLYLHGIQSHGGWFANSATVRANRGFPVLLPDRRGSGANGVDRGHVASVGRALDDGQTLLAASADLFHPAEPVHVLGVSWGGKWGLGLAAEFPDRVASLILSTPGLYAHQTLGPAARLGVAFCSLFWPRR